MSNKRKKNFVSQRGILLTFHPSFNLSNPAKTSSIFEWKQANTESVRQTKFNNGKTSQPYLIKLVRESLERLFFLRFAKVSLSCSGCASTSPSSRLERSLSFKTALRRPLIFLKSGTLPPLRLSSSKLGVLSKIALFPAAHSSIAFSDNDASFLRIDFISLTYRLENLFKGSNTIGISFTVQNPIIVTDYEGLDPEIDDGIDNNLYPRPRTFVVGLVLNFK